MRVDTLRQILDGLDGDAQIIIQTKPNPHFNGSTVGPILHVAIARIDGRDRTVAFSNCQATGSSDGKLDFNGPATVKAATGSTANGMAAAAAQLEEDFSLTPAQSIADFLESQRLRSAQQRLNALIEQEAAGHD